MGDLVCDNCGGNDFYKESGFYYCSECQIQSQEVQEQVFQIDDAGINKKKTKKIQESKKNKEENKITSWECYNYIMLGLTQELIGLGADSKLKDVVKILWLRYLEKLEVFKLDRDELPKLQAVASRGDAEIIYGVKRKRKRGGSTKSSIGSSSNECDTTTLDSSSIKRERAKRRRQLVQSHYDKYTEATTSGTPSLHNETLQSIQGSSERTTTRPPVTYNIYATKELRKKIRKQHFTRHCYDLSSQLNCHLIGGKYMSKKYLESAQILTIDKLYSVLYLGLLIIGDKIQLGDLLRFISEGKLSFNYYYHIYPEDYSDKTLNLNTRLKTKIFAHHDIREKTSKIAEFLNVTRYIMTPNLCELCQRFCKDLNLPDEISRLAEKIIIKSQMKMPYRKKKKMIPDYEGRVLSIILIILKTLFGIDGITEYKLSNFAAILNHSSSIEPKMFNIDQWLQYIEYRQTVLKDYNINFTKTSYEQIPLNIYYRSLINSKLPEVKLRKTGMLFKENLTQLANHLEELKPIEFQTTFTPSIDHLETIMNNQKCLTKVLLQEFRNNKLAYILTPQPFLSVLQRIQEIKLKNGGAKDKWRREPLVCIKKEGIKAKRAQNEFVIVKPVFGKVKPLTEPPPIIARDGENFPSNFDESNILNYKNSVKRLFKLPNCDNYDLKALYEDLLEFDWNYPEHFTPFQRYWLRSCFTSYLMTWPTCNTYLKEAPASFRIIFDDLCRIGQHTALDLLKTFVVSELYLVYSYNSNCYVNTPSSKLSIKLKNYQKSW